MSRPKHRCRSRRLSELLGPVGAETFELLAPPRRRALRVALLLEEPDGSAPEAHAIGLAVLDLFGVLSQQGPVVVAVDDIQWLDAASAAVMYVALRRLRDSRVGMLATVRESTERPVAIELEHCFVEGRLERCSVGPLSLAALHHLVRDRVGLELSRSELVRLEAVTRGNPYFALEVGQELVRLGRHLAPDEPLPVPDGLAELLGVRLARLSTTTRDVLLTAALAARPTTAVLWRVFGDERRIQMALDEAAASGVVVLTDGQVRFAHPLLASVICEQTPRPKRSAQHRVLAGVVGDVEEAARHRALGYRWSRCCGVVGAGCGSRARGESGSDRGWSGAVRAGGGADACRSCAC